MSDHAPSTNAQPPLTDDDLERVAREESVAPVTVLRALAGLPVRGLACDRARRAAEKLRRKVA